MSSNEMRVAAIFKGGAVGHKKAGRGIETAGQSFCLARLSAYREGYRRVLFFTWLPRLFAGGRDPPCGGHMQIFSQSLMRKRR